MDDRSDRWRLDDGDVLPLPLTCSESQGDQGIRRTDGSVSIYCSYPFCSPWSLAILECGSIYLLVPNAPYDNIFSDLLIIGPESCTWK